MDTENVLSALLAVEHECHQTSLDHGWWEKHDQLKRAIGGEHSSLISENKEEIDRLYVLSKLMLSVSELSEAVEGVRGDKMDDHLPRYKMIEVEIADCFVRLFDLSKRFDLHVCEALLAKMEYNKSRPYRHGNKLA
jgi:NTP pyrophosphatase (non-canonical NTP hydrolase)